MKKNFQIELDLPEQMREYPPAELKKIFEKQILPVILERIPEKRDAAKAAEPAKNKIDLTISGTVSDGGGKGTGGSATVSIVFHF
jgi:mevalonate kinase